MLNDERRTARQANRPGALPFPVGDDAKPAHGEDGGPVAENQSSPLPEGPLGDVLQSGAVTEATRAVLQRRLAALDASWPVEGAFFSADELATLRALVRRFVPQDDRQKPVDIAIAIDRRLAEGRSGAWRLAALPSDGEAYRLAHRGFDEFARARHGRRFSELNSLQQDALIARVQRGRALGAAWEQLEAPLFFTEMLAEVTEIYYSDPIVQISLGYIGFADQPGWDALGLNQSDPREPAVPALSQRSSRRAE